MRVRRYSPRTEEAYVDWVRRFIVFHGKTHPGQMGADEVTAYLSFLATEQRVAASTQNQALAAILFLYREVLGCDLPWLEDVVRARRPKHIPVVLTRDEVARMIAATHGTPRLVCALLYGTGMRLLECLRLRIKDVDFGRNELTIRRGKGDRDRLTVLPAMAQDALRDHVAKARRMHEKDLAAGAGWVELPHAIGRKYPNAGQEWPWQWVFPATRTYLEDSTGQRRRHHLHESVIQRAVRNAVRIAGITKRASPLGHKDVSTTMIYTHVLNRGPNAVRSPADRILLPDLLKNQTKPGSLDITDPNPPPPPPFPQQTHPLTKPK